MLAHHTPSPLKLRRCFIATPFAKLHPFGNRITQDLYNILLPRQLAFYTGPTVGGLLNATFGNATELIISIHAMKSGLLRVVQQSLLGSILSNMLLVLGSAFFIGGISHSNKQQVFNKANAEMNSGLLLMAVMGLMFPAVLHVTHTELHYGKSELALSRFSSCVMLVAYAAYLFFQLKSQRNLYGTINEEESQADGSLVDEEAPEITKWESIIWLFILTMWISFLSEYLVNAIEFEEKLVKFHIEKKEQELTAQNAQTHQQKLSSLENFVVAKNGEESAESDIVEDETDADVSDPSVEGMDQSSHNVSKSKVELDEHSQASSEVTELEPCENEVQSPMTAIHLRGTSKSKAKKSSMKVQRGRRQVK